MGSLQLSIKQNGHNCTKTLVKPNDCACTKPIGIADSCLNGKNHLQIRINIDNKAWQGHDESREDLPATLKQNRSIQAAEQAKYQAVCQPTLRAMGRLSWCMYEHENSKNDSFIHEIRSQDSEMMLRVLTKPTRAAARSCTRQCIDKG